MSFDPEKNSAYEVEQKAPELNLAQKSRALFAVSSLVLKLEQLITAQDKQPDIAKKPKYDPVKLKFELKNLWSQAPILAQLSPNAAEIVTAVLNQIDRGKPVYVRAVLHNLKMLLAELGTLEKDIQAEREIALATLIELVPNPQNREEIQKLKNELASIGTTTSGAAENSQLEARSAELTPEEKIDSDHPPLTRTDYSPREIEILQKIAALERFTPEMITPELMFSICDQVDSAAMVPLTYDFSGDAHLVLPQPMNTYEIKDRHEVASALLKIAILDWRLGKRGSEFFLKIMLTVDSYGLSEEGFKLMREWRGYSQEDFETGVQGTITFRTKEMADGKSEEQILARAKEIAALIPGATVDWVLEEKYNKIIAYAVVMQSTSVPDDEKENLLGEMAKKTENFDALHLSLLPYEDILYLKIVAEIFREMGHDERIFTQKLAQNYQVFARWFAMGLNPAEALQVQVGVDSVEGMDKLFKRRKQQVLQFFKVKYGISPDEEGTIAYDAYLKVTEPTTIVPAAEAEHRMHAMLLDLQKESPIFAPVKADSFRVHTKPSNTCRASNTALFDTEGNLVSITMLNVNDTDSSVRRAIAHESGHWYEYMFVPLAMQAGLVEVAPPNSEERWSQFLEILQLDCTKERVPTPPGLPFESDERAFTEGGGLYALAYVNGILPEIFYKYYQLYGIQLSDSELAALVAEIKQLIDDAYEMFTNISGLNGKARGTGLLLKYMMTTTDGILYIAQDLKAVQNGTDIGGQSEAAESYKMNNVMVRRFGEKWFTLPIAPLLIKYMIVRERQLGLERVENFDMQMDFLLDEFAGFQAGDSQDQTNIGDSEVTAAELLAKQTYDFVVHGISPQKTPVHD